MMSYPIILNLRDPVIGRRFLAGVEVHGRALMREEKDGYWIDGVNPGAVCAGGKSRDEALLRFRDSYRAILYSFAAAASSFEEFQAEVERFFWEQTPGEAAAWTKAARELRADPSKAGDWLPVRSEYPEPHVMVAWLAGEIPQAANDNYPLQPEEAGQRLEPEGNPAEEMELAAA
jgi:hypothetical protein